MKSKTEKIALIIAIVIILLVIIGGVIGGYFFFKYVKLAKEAITSKEFIQIMEDNDFEIADVTEQFEDADIEVKKGYVALGDDYQIEFYTFDDEDEAKMFFKVNKAKFETDSASSEVSLNGKNYSVYSVTSNGKYKFVERIDKTVIYLNVDKEHKDDVKDLVKELGY